MPKSKNSAQERYGLQQKAISARWRELGKPMPYKEFCRSAEAKRMRLSISNPGPAGADTTAASDAEPQPGPSGIEQRPVVDREGGLANDDFDLFAELADMGDIQLNAAVPGSVGTRAAQGGAKNNMQVDAVSGGTGGGVGAVGGGGGPAIFPPVTYSNGGTHVYKKRWWKYSYGLAIKTIVGPQLSQSTTSLAYYPVDWLPWYLSPAEFKALPAGSRVTKVKSTFRLLGTRTGFDHGTTLSGTATTEYVPIAKFCTGLNKKMNIYNGTAVLKSTEPMTVENITQVDLSLQYAKMYSYGGAIEIPRHHNWYASMLINSDDSKDDTFGSYAQYGMFRTDEVLSTCMVNEVLGQPIIQYEYEPKNGMLTRSKACIAGNLKDAKMLSSYTMQLRSRMPEMTDLIPVSRKAGIVNLAPVTTPHKVQFTNRIGSSYFQSIEGPPSFDPHTGISGTWEIQPQVHIGLLATPALNPAVDTAQFLNSCLYVVCDTECHVSFDHNTCYADGTPVDRIGETRFYPNYPRGYAGDGHHVLGLVSDPRARAVNKIKGNKRSKRCDHEAESRREDLTRGSDEESDFGIGGLKVRRSTRRGRGELETQEKHASTTDTPFIYVDAEASPNERDSFDSDEEASYQGHTASIAGSSTTRTQSRTRTNTPKHGSR